VAAGEVSYSLCAELAEHVQRLWGQFGVAALQLRLHHLSIAVDAPSVLKNQDWSGVACFHGAVAWHVPVLHFVVSRHRRSESFVGGMTSHCVGEHVVMGLHTRSDA